jgi:hypothetical protein
MREFTSAFFNDALQLRTLMLGPLHLMTSPPSHFLSAAGRLNRVEIPSAFRDGDWASFGTPSAMPATLNLRKCESVNPTGSFGTKYHTQFAKMKLPDQVELRHFGTDGTRPAFDGLTIGRGWKMEREPDRRNWELEPGGRKGGDGTAPTRGAWWASNASRVTSSGMPMKRRAKPARWTGT